jgi:glycosyltransferase involved in cell wall biosynthesis
VIRVAVDATPLLGERTGVGVFVAHALEAMAGRPDVDLVAYATTWRRRGALPSVLPHGIGAVGAPMPAGALQAAWRRADWPVIERWTGPVAVVHGTNCVVPPTRRAAQVVSVHDLSFVHYPELCAPESLRYPALIRRALGRGAFVHALSATVAAEIVDAFGAAPERVRVVPLAVDRAPLAVDTPDGRRPATSTGRPYVLALGRAEPRKDLPLLVAAFDAVAGRHPDMDLVIAGPPGWGEDALAEAVGAATHQDRVRRLGWVSDDQRAQLLAGATVLAYPSRYEGFGLPPLEAMAAGVPVVTTDAGAIPSVVGDAAAIVPVGDLDALAGALDTLLDSEPARARLVEAGRARVAQFSWERCAAGLVSLYRDAASAATGAAAATAPTGT